MFVSNKKLYRHAKEVLDNRRLEHLIFFDGDSAADRECKFIRRVGRTGSEHAKERPEAFDAYLHAVRPDDLATMIYTSGTTGEPKGVMLTHNNFMSNVLSITAGLPISETDTALSVLPLSHIFERAGFYVFIYNGLEVYYSASFDQVGENLREVAPTVMTAVPRLFRRCITGSSRKAWRRRVGNAEYLLVHLKWVNVTVS